MPLYPMLDDRMQTESACDNNAPVWDSASNAQAWQRYLGELCGGDVPSYAAPARATDYTGLPPAVTFVGDIEPFRDETIAYIDNLRNAGVPAELAVYPACDHAFDMLAPTSQVARQAGEFFIAAYRHAADHYFAAQPIEKRAAYSVAWALRACAKSWMKRDEEAAGDHLLSLLPAPGPCLRTRISPHCQSNPNRRA